MSSWEDSVEQKATVIIIIIIVKETGFGRARGVIEIKITRRTHDETNRFKNEAPPPLLDTATVTYTIVDY